MPSAETIMENESNVMSTDAGERRAMLDKRGYALERIADTIMVLAALGVATALVWLLSDVMLLVFAATLVACQLRGLAKGLGRRTRLSYGLSLAIVVVAIGGVIAALGYLRGPVIVSEFHHIYDEIDRRASQMWSGTGHEDWLQQAVERVRAYLHSKSGALAGRAAGFVTSTIGNLGSLLLILVGAIYLAASPETYEAGLLRLLPRGWRERGAQVLAAEGRALRRWFVGQLVDMLAIGIMTGIGLWLLGIPLFPTLALIAALANFVPYIGALAGSVPAIVVAFGQSPSAAISVAILFVAVQTIEGNLISPMISRRTVELPPVLTLFSQTVLGSLLGPLGLILATPITAALMVLVRMVYVETILGEHPARRHATARGEAEPTDPLPRPSARPAS